MSPSCPASIDKALDKVIDWIVTMAKKLFAKAFGKDDKKDEKDERTDQQKQADLHSGVTEAEALLKQKDATPESVTAKLPPIQAKYKLASLTLVKLEGNKYAIDGTVNPEEKGEPVELAGDWPVKVDDNIVGVPGSSRIEKVLSLNPENTISYTLTARGQTGKSTRSKDSFLELWNAGQIRLSPKSAAEQLAEWTRLWGSDVAQAISDRDDLAVNLQTQGSEQAHHIIPVSILKKQGIVRMLVQSGWDFNQKTNGVPLEEGFHGSHPQYTTYVNNQIDAWVQQHGTSNVDDFRDYVETQLIPALRTKIDDAKSKYGTTDENLNTYFSKLL